MSVSSERSCISPASSNGSGSCSSSSGHMKLKRRWIEMSHIDEEHQLASSEPALSPKSARLSQNRSQISDQSCTPVQPRIVLPADPRLWTKRDVSKWLKYMALTYDIEISHDKFDMNGKALCMMTMDMFVKRVPVGGKFLYRDFRLRLYPAVFFQKTIKPDYSKMTPLEMLALTTGKYFP